MIQALSEMSPKARNLIAEISYAPDKNKQNRIKIFTKDNIQVIGDITTIADKMKYYPQMSESLSRSDSGDLKQMDTSIFQLVHRSYHIKIVQVHNQNLNKVYRKHHKKKQMQKKNFRVC